MLEYLVMLEHATAQVYMAMHGYMAMPKYRGTVFITGVTQINEKMKILGEVVFTTRIKFTILMGLLHISR